MSEKYILAIDQGTTGTTVCLLKTDGELTAKATVEFPQIYPRPGWVEHDPDEIWKSVMAATEKVFSNSQIDKSQILAIGITNQRETVTMWDRATMAPVYNSIVWQCRRTSEFCDLLKKKNKSSMIRKRTGLVIDPYFSGSKIRWILKNVPGVRARAIKGELAVGTMDTYLLWRLTGGLHHKTDVSNASRTMLMNIETGKWDEKMLEIFDVPLNLLPEICASSGLFGKTRGLDFLPDNIPITGVAGDQQAALFGQTCFEAGEAKCTYGTGSFLLMNTGKKMVQSTNGLLTTVAWQLPGEKKMTYALEGGAFICGAAVQWLRDGLQLISKSSEVEELAISVADTQGVEFVPALTGLGAPYWDAEARGTICGLTRGTTKAHIARATLEGMALQNTDILLAMQKDLGKKMTAVKVDGGASANSLLMQLQSDYLGVSITRPKYIETTVMGAAFLAGIGIGLWKTTTEIRRVWKAEKSFEPDCSKIQREKRLSLWHKAIAKARCY